MSRILYSLFFLLTFSLSSTCWAENEGQEDLDKATELQLKVQSLRDAEQVIKLCESAIQKGLDENNTKFAKQLLVSSLWQHASQLASVIFDGPRPDPRWQPIRKIILGDLEKLLMHEPKFGDAHVLMAKLQILPGGDVERAKKAVEQASEIYKDDKSKLADILVVQAQLETDAEKQLGHLTKAIETDPANAQAWQARAAYFLTRGQLDKAVADFEKLLEREPNNLAIRHAIAEALSNLDKHDMALEHANKAIEMQPEIADSYTLRARIHERKEDYQAAIADLDQAIKIDADNLLALYTRARVHLIEEDYKEASEDLKKFLQLQPDSAQGILLRSMIAASQNNYAEAISDLQLLLRGDPRNVTFRMQLGKYYLADQRPRKAVELFTTLVEEDMSNAEALRYRADALLNIGKHQEAVKDYEAALKVNPEDSGILNNLAWVFATSTVDEVRNPKRALELALKACEVTKYEMPHILSTLAAAYAENGDWENAVKWSEKAVELGREGLKDQIDQLEKELESYKAKKPWREMQQIEDKPEPPRRVIDT